ncbi:MULTISPECIES: hypothetical protein [Pasteurellaceae]|uniref:Mu-like prophage FluMu N-terminal domain-containing protein n=1 Tax=Pasteurella atlantica TaxID=2827233 RepID=A0AAW8CTM2_9PAST|nr:hypothetical protein [Pasteurella atlantica]MBR0574077.1 hypothetical protein [Pasteurella atlantica]MDP8040100.1 hypothetical protein [Pasteurella atlantica]MDP8042213.1 hypothetical protein [Pasteurella atlantica]MDP8044380.1 hypothetical protein [Pasteurella atlantica]MDP8046372.1 hypothetical protein [Pasteurella atlantica]
MTKKKTKNKEQQIQEQQTQEPEVPKTEVQKQQNQTKTVCETTGMNVVEVDFKAIEVTLRSTHPNESYGRAGYRFFKDKAVLIEAEDVDIDLLNTLETDPYLAVEFIAE